MTLTYHIDPGHGWLEVSASDLAAVNLTAHDFSDYSYYTRGRLYLEEDSDMGTFMRAYQAQHGRFPDIHERYSNHDSFVRCFRRLRESRS